MSSPASSTSPAARALAARANRPASATPVVPAVLGPPGATFAPPLTMPGADDSGRPARSQPLAPVPGLAEPKLSAAPNRQPAHTRGTPSPEAASLAPTVMLPPENRDAVMSLVDRRIEPAAAVTTDPRTGPGSLTQRLRRTLEPESARAPAAAGATAPASSRLPAIVVRPAAEPPAPQRSPAIDPRTPDGATPEPLAPTPAPTPAVTIGEIHVHTTDLTPPPDPLALLEPYAHSLTTWPERRR